MSHACNAFNFNSETSGCSARAQGGYITRERVGALEQFTSRFASLVAENEALRNENEVLRNID